MPASLVALTEGAGKNLETWQWVIGANTVERQVIAQGEQHLASYIVGHGTTGGAVSTATANSHLMQISAGASLKVRIRRLQVIQSALATTAVLGQILIVRLSTAGTGGTAQTPAALDPADAASGATAMHLPTAKGTEGGILYESQPYFIQTLTASLPNWPILLDVDFDRLRPKPLIIAAGAANGIAIKQITAVAAATVWMNVWLDEANF